MILCSNSKKLDSPANDEGQSGVGKQSQNDISTESQSHYEITTESQSENITERQSQITTESQSEITTESQSEITTESQSEITQSQSEITKSRKSTTLHSAAEPEVTPTTIQNSTQPDSLSAGKPPVSSSKPVGLPYRIAFKYETVHEWLYFSAAKNGYCCKYCELFADISSQPSPFVTGTNLGDHPVRKLGLHDVSQRHKDATAKYAAILNASNTAESSLLKLLKSTKSKEESEVERNRAYIGTLITSTLFIVRKRWALDSMNDFISIVDELEWPSVTQYLTRNPANRYTSSTSVTDILDCINSYFESSLLEQVRKCDYFSLLADESSDEANRTQFAILIRCQVNRSVDDHLLGIINVSRTDAATLMREIERFLLAKGVDISKVKR